MPGLPAFHSGERRRSSRIQLGTNTGSNSSDLSARSTPTISSSRSTPAEKSARKTTKDLQIVDPEPTPSKRPGLRTRNTPINSGIDPIQEAMKPLTDEERRNWKGWVDFDSDPELFNFILREYGVRDVRIKEITFLCDEVLASLPKPVYGMIFLYKYLEEEEEEEDEEIPKCPKHVWFANQTIDNACATIALLNIVMNVEEIDLGDGLATFKSYTQNLKPAYRGKKLGENDFIRNIHNSFARRMDILNADLSLANGMEKWRIAKNSKRKGATAKKSKKEDELAFHYVAYVPIKGEVWRLNGLQRHPVNLGAYQRDWMAIVQDNIQQHISKYASQENNVFFSLLSLCKTPLLTIPNGLAENIHSISAIESALNVALPDWKEFLSESELGIETGPNDAYGVTQDIFNTSAISQSVQQALDHAGTDAGDLLELYKKWAQQQNRDKELFIQEAASIGNMDEIATRRKHDYTPTIYNSLKTLAENGVLKKIVEDTRAD